MLTDQILCFVFGAALTGIISYSVYSERLDRVRFDCDRMLKKQAEITAKAVWDNTRF